jgi:hypothetical protein
MEEIITYSLRNRQSHSDSYYQEIAVFADEVLNRIHLQAGLIIKNYQDFVDQNDIESVRSSDEYALEFLMLGTFWQVHGKRALRLNTASQRILEGLGKYRKEIEILKGFFDFWRGVLGNILIASPNGRPPAIFTLENLSRLMDWMSATGELTEETKRLKQWQTYFKSQSPESAAKSLTVATELSSWFASRSLEVLGPYTNSVDEFLIHKHPQYRWREDNFFCGRERVEYHFSMVGTEILNRNFRDAFLQTERKIVLLPPCMKAKLEDGCEAVETPHGERCMACTPGCRVHQLTKLGEKRGFMVMVMPHDMKVFSEDKDDSKKSGSTGIVGVSCPLTNTAGGWEMKSVGVPAQGMLLDYCGCPWHWHEEGIPTDINFNQVLILLDG